MPNEYIQSIITKHKLPVGAETKAHQAAQQLTQIIRVWAGEVLENICPIGSYVKGTSVTGSSEIDLLVSLNVHTCGTIKDLSDNLFSYLQSNNFAPQRKQYSIRLMFLNTSVELFLSRSITAKSTNDVLYCSITNTCLETKTQSHTELILMSNRIEEIQAIKIWRNLTCLKFPTLYLELTVLNALFNRKKNRLEKNFLNVMEYLMEGFLEDTVTDPANPKNIISDLLTAEEKKAVAAAAKIARNQADWSNILW
ncbi:MAG: hypothetical protein QME52_01820 [Bacteroidota bacterium]|nr:hypothetical protein [Bacteroidota bacterium]